MVPRCLEEMAGRTRLIKYQLTKLLVPTLALQVCFCPVSSTRLKMGTVYPHRQSTNCQIRQTGMEQVGQQAPQICFAPGHQNHTHTLHPQVCYKSWWDVLYKENCKYLIFMYPNCWLSFHGLDGILGSSYYSLLKEYLLCIPKSVSLSLSHYY